MSLSTMKTQTLDGIPYTLGPQNELYLHGSEPTLQIGTYNSVTKEVVLIDKWQTVLDSWLTQYRANLKAATEAAMKKAFEHSKN